MKRIKRILLIILLLLVAALIVLGIRYKDYIKAAYYGLKYDTDTISGLIEENDKVYSELGNELENVTIRDLTDEEKTALEKGELTEQEVVDRIVTPSVPKDEEPAQESEQTETKPQPPDKEPSVETKNYDELIAQQIAKMYVLKSQYINYLKGIEQNVIDDYNALPKEQKNAAGKRAVIMSYYSKGLALETECDAKVEMVLADLEKILDEAGRDKSLISTIRTAYQNEKTLQKSYYLSIYNS